MLTILALLLAQSVTNDGADEQGSEAHQLRERLTQVGSEDAAGRSHLVRDFLATVVSEEVRVRLCSEFGATLTTRQVRVELRDSWGDLLPAVLVEGGKVSAILPLTGGVQECMPYVLVRQAGGSEDLKVHIDWEARQPLALLRLPGPTAASVLSALGQFSWVYPGWRNGTQFHGSGGVRLATWREWVHADVALKLSTFVSPYWSSAPGNLAVDAFIGFPVTVPLGGFELRGSIDAGVWSTVCPSVRLSLAVLRGPLVLGLDYGTHLYPLALLDPVYRTKSLSDVPIGNFIFWDVGASLGWRFD